MSTPSDKLQGSEDIVRVNQRLAFLLNATSLLSETLDYESRLRQAAQIAVPRIADWCAIDILGEDGLLRRLSVVHSNPAKIDLVYEIERRYPPEPDPTRGTYKVITSLQPEFYQELPAGLLEASARDAEHLRLIRELGLRSAIVVPLAIRGKAFGVLTLVMAESNRHYTSDDLDLATELARHAAMYIENSRLYTSMQSEVRARTEQLEAANRELESFSYSVSHDLRAPLRHLSGFVQLLDKRARPNLDETAIHYLDTIADAAQRMGLLIDDLLSFSRLGRAELRFTKVDLNPIVRRICEDETTVQPHRIIDLKISTLPEILGDSAMLEQVFRNLIDNAFKFTAKHEVAEIEIGTRKEATETIFYVRDNGAGFDSAYADRLFGVFQRLHSQTDFEGTGIGLANVRRVVERHGGRTWAEGEPDKGATFFLSLPIQPLKEASR